MQVAPAELEAHLLEHPAVADAAVIEVDDDRNGEVPRAFVVKRADSTLTDDKLVKELHESFRKHKARYKWLKGGIKIRRAIPKSPSGKILRQVLRNEQKDNKRRILAAKI